MVSHARPLEEGRKLCHPRGVRPIATADPGALVVGIVVAFRQHTLPSVPPQSGVNIDPDHPPAAVVHPGVCAIVIKLEASELSNGMLDGKHGVC